VQAALFVALPPWRPGRKRPSAQLVSIGEIIDSASSPIYFLCCCILNKIVLLVFSEANNYFFCMCSTGSWTPPTKESTASTPPRGRLSKASPIFVRRPDKTTDILFQPSVLAGVLRFYLVAELVILPRGGACRSLRHHCRPVRRFPSSSSPTWRGCFPTLTLRRHCRSSCGGACRRVRRGGFSRRVREAQLVEECGAHGLREAHALEMVEAPNKISPAARRGCEQEEAPSEPSAVAAAAQAANGSGDVTV
jgi:hypothetical protein